MLMSMSQIPRPATGYAAWRLIAEELRADMTEGRQPVGSRLPSENELAQRFSVNRQTARQAIAALAADGLVEARRGSGTFVTDTGMHVHRIGMRTRLSNSLGASSPATRRILEHAIEVPPPDVAARLKPLGETAIRIEGMRILDGRPLTRGTAWFDPVRLPDIVSLLRSSGSVTTALRAAGIEDYFRRSTTVTARHATAAEASDLELEPGSVVLVTQGFDVLPDGTPLQVNLTRFAAARVALDIDIEPQ
jgi:GntR family phosphonate transport system transcriptional regulator